MVITTLIAIILIIVSIIIIGYNIITILDYKISIKNKQGKLKIILSERRIEENV
jgi:hypothetical protein